MDEKYIEYAYYGGPYDRGSADAYYSRPKQPHKYTEGTHTGEKVTTLTAEEIEAYLYGYDNEHDRKKYT